MKPYITTPRGKILNLEKGLKFSLYIQLTPVFQDALTQPEMLTLSAAQSLAFFNDETNKEVAAAIIEDLQCLVEDIYGNPMLHGMVELDTMLRHKNSYCKELIAWLEEAESIAQNKKEIVTEPIPKSLEEWKEFFSTTFPKEKEYKKMWVLVGGYKGDYKQRRIVSK